MPTTVAYKIEKKTLDNTFVSRVALKAMTYSKVVVATQNPLVAILF